MKKDRLTLCLSQYHLHSKYICSGCELSVHHFYEFWEMVQSVQKKLSFLYHKENPSNTVFTGLQTDHKHDLGLNLCHTTGITSDSEPVLIKINVVKHIQCDVCKTGLCMSQLISLHQVTHGLGTVLCECEQCGHQDDIGTFLQDKNNVHCPQCSFRKFSQVINNTVDVQTQFISSDKTDNSNAAQSYAPNSSNDFESQCKPDRNPKEAEDKISQVINNTDKNNVHCPQCSFRKFSQVINNTVDVQTQFISSDKTDNSNAAQSYVPNSSNDFESQCKPDRNPKEAEDKMEDWNFAIKTDSDSKTTTIDLCFGQEYSNNPELDNSLADLLSQISLRPNKTMAPPELKNEHLKMVPECSGEVALLPEYISVCDKVVAYFWDNQNAASFQNFS
ncbi:uncharacterized protein LOC108252778 [Diaphorina citri]|uniref:Uncharacterized protein LOC108252778 n=1 Tax=Diaphorina citri TaxID=121845 RepID=A0A3Q0J4M3_DIACI|nr:uncharacterized protein LOC108252778 [Diaphorina citri]